MHRRGGGLQVCASQAVVGVPTSSPPSPSSTLRNENNSPPSRVRLRLVLSGPPLPQGGGWGRKAGGGGAGSSLSGRTPPVGGRQIQVAFSREAGVEKAQGKIKTISGERLFRAKPKPRGQLSREGPEAKPSALLQGGELCIREGGYSSASLGPIGYFWLQWYAFSKPPIFGSQDPPGADPWGFPGGSLSLFFPLVAQKEPSREDHPVLPSSSGSPLGIRPSKTTFSQTPAGWVRESQWGFLTAEGEGEGMGKRGVWVSPPKRLNKRPAPDRLFTSLQAPAAWSVARAPQTPPTANSCSSYQF